MALLLGACSERHDNVYVILHRLDYASCHVLEQTDEDCTSIYPVDFSSVDLTFAVHTQRNCDVITLSLVKPVKHGLLKITKH